MLRKRRGHSRLLNSSNDNCTRGYNVCEANRINADVTHTEYIIRDKNLLGMAAGNIAAGPFESARAPFVRAPSMRLGCVHAYHAPYACLCALYAIYDLDPCAQRQRNASFSLSLSLPLSVSFSFFFLFLSLCGTSSGLPPILLSTLTEEGTRSCEGRREERGVAGEGRDRGRGRRGAREERRIREARTKGGIGHSTYTLLGFN